MLVFNTSTYLNGDVINFIAARKMTDIYICILATKGEQLDTIHHALCVNGFLKRHQAHCWVIARIVHSLVQVDPTLRDANAALKLLDDLEAEVEKEELMAEAQGTTD